MSTKQKPSRARPADPADAAPASLDVSTGAEAAREGAADDGCGLCGGAAEYTALRADGEGPAPLCLRCLKAALGARAPSYDELLAERAALRAELARAPAALEAATLQAQESDAEALQALCAAQRQHPQDKVAAAINLLALRIAERVLA